MNVLEQAIDQRKKQLMRQANAQTNPLIKQICLDEIEQLRVAWDAIKNTTNKK